MNLCNNFIVRSGGGFFIEFKNNTPEMTSDPDKAYLMDAESARNVKKLFEQYGFEAEIIRANSQEDKCKDST